MLSASAHGEVLRILIDRPERIVALKAAWSAQGLEVHNLRQVKPRLEDAFVLLLTRKGAA